MIFLKAIGITVVTFVIACVIFNTIAVNLMKEEHNDEPKK